MSPYHAQQSQSLLPPPRPSFSLTFFFTFLPPGGNAFIGRDAAACLKTPARLFPVFLGIQAGLLWEGRRFFCLSSVMDGSRFSSSTPSLLPPPCLPFQATGFQDHQAATGYSSLSSFLSAHHCQPCRLSHAKTDSHASHACLPDSLSFFLGRCQCLGVFPATGRRSRLQARLFLLARLPATTRNRAAATPAFAATPACLQLNTLSLLLPAQPKSYAGSRANSH